MKQFTIKEAIIKILTEERKPMLPKEIHDKIVESNYFKFGAKDPVQMVSSVLRLHCIGVETKKSSKNKHFQKSGNGTFSLIK